MEQQICTLIIDDERLARTKIRSLLEKRPDILICSECTNGMEALQCIDQYAPDLIFLDIQMPEMDGFEFIDAIDPPKMPAVIFVTAFDQFAIQAFEKHALDYLLKPYNATRFYASLDRAVSNIRNKQKGEMQNQLIDLLKEMSIPRKFIERIVIKTNHRVLFLKVDDVDWMEADGNYLDIHSGENTYLLRETLNNMEEKLDPSRFLRIHRSRIVNINQIQELKSASGQDCLVIMKDHTQLVMSRRYREKFNKCFGNYF